MSTATLASAPAPPLVADVARIRRLLEAHLAGAPADPTSSGDERSAAAGLAVLLGLSAFERDLLLLAAAVELDGEVARIVAVAQGGADPRPTFALALAVLPDGHWDAIGPEAPLRRWRLLEPGPGPTLVTRPLALDERVLHHLTGVAAGDGRLEGVVAPAPPPVALAPSQAGLADELARAVAGAPGRVLVCLGGADRAAGLGVAQALARAAGRTTLLVRAAALPAVGPELAGLVRLVDREALLAGALPVIDPPGAAPEAPPALCELLEAPLVVLLGAGAACPGRTLVRRDVALPEPAEGRALWTDALGAAAGGLAGVVESVSEHHRLGAGDIAALARAWRLEPGGGGEALRRLCRERSRADLDGLAERIAPRVGWDDLVLPEGQRALLCDLERRVRHRTQVHERWGFDRHGPRGLGVTALFSGESGTGKTMAAEVLAGALGLDLYRIDLSAVVSKYIGETEKNLGRLFDAAEAAGAVLLFDEADALFGKRGEVRDGHDRYANLEVAYLLQRMEGYRGLAVLTTNLRSNVDRAFLRRLGTVVQFPFPDEAQRAAIWSRAFPPATPLAGVDPARLARLQIAGGTIRAIALGAAFAAAAAGTPVTPAQVLHAARIEYAKAERTLTASESGGWA